MYYVWMALCGVSIFLALLCANYHVWLWGGVAGVAAILFLALAARTALKQ